MEKGEGSSFLSLTVLGPIEEELGQEGSLKVALGLGVASLKQPRSPPKPVDHRKGANLGMEGGCGRARAHPPSVAANSTGHRAGRECEVRLPPKTQLVFTARESTGSGGVIPQQSEPVMGVAGQGAKEDAGGWVASLTVQVQGLEEGALRVGLDGGKRAEAAGTLVGDRAEAAQLEEVIEDVDARACIDALEGWVTHQEVVAMARTTLLLQCQEECTHSGLARTDEVSGEGGLQHGGAHPMEIISESLPSDVQGVQASEV